jgi:3-hydroxyisobutyrate dehydrogenase
VHIKNLKEIGMKVGLIGAGNIGQHFATRILAAGHELVIFDLNKDVLSRFKALGAEVATGVADLASRVSDVYLCLPVPAAVQSVVAEVVKGSAVKMLIDLSTTGPSVTKEVHDVLSQRGIAFVSAPVSGGTLAAQHGTLAVMAAGDTEAFKKAETILKVIGKNIFFLGEDPSLGQTMKIINNTLYATSMLASCEALVYGVKAGLDSKTMLDVLNVSSGRSFATLERIPQGALDRNFTVRFTTELLHKDIKMCLDEAEKIGAPMFINQNARQFLAFAMTQGDGPKDNLFPIRHFEEWAGVQFGKKPE